MKIRNHFQQVSEFDRGSIVNCREFGLSFHDITLRTGRNITTVLRIWNQWVAEARRETSRPLRINARENRHTVKSALENRKTTSWICT
ncbi:hypothetical protein TNCV_4334381 [Trichonephila clavipes]|nr:hypothetical protein TNCV_4334381 [Trichonephila clavipes]